MTVFELVKILINIILSGNVNENDRIYFKDSEGNFHNITSYKFTNYEDIILMEEY